MSAWPLLPLRLRQSRAVPRGHIQRGDRRFFEHHVRAVPGAALLSRGVRRADALPAGHVLRPNRGYIERHLQAALRYGDAHSNGLRRVVSQQFALGMRQHVDISHGGGLEHATSDSLGVANDIGVS